MHKSKAEHEAERLAVAKCRDAEQDAWRAAFFPAQVNAMEASQDELRHEIAKPFQEQSMEATTAYGFSSANASDEPAWFATRAEAEQFARNCGWDMDTLEIEEADASDVEVITL